MIPCENAGAVVVAKALHQPAVHRLSQGDLSCQPGWFPQFERLRYLLVKGQAVRIAPIHVLNQNPDLTAADHAHLFGIFGGKDEIMDDGALMIEGLFGQLLDPGFENPAADGPDDGAVAAHDHARADGAGGGTVTAEDHRQDNTFPLGEQFRKPVE